MSKKEMALKFALGVVTAIAGAYAIKQLKKHGVL